MSHRALLLVLAVFFVARWALVAASVDAFGYDEEFAKAAVGKALIDRLDVPVSTLVYGPHEGGGFVVSLLDAAAFLVVGPSVLAVKLVAILMQTVVLAAALHFARVHLARGAAWFVAIAWILAPDSIVRLSLLALGTHGEATLFVILVLHFGLLVGRDEHVRNRDAWCLGLCAGFGVYVSLQVVAPIVAVVLTLWARKRANVFARWTLHVVCAALVGAVPWFWMLASRGKSVVSVRGQVDVGGGLGWFESVSSLFAPLTHPTSAFGPAHVAAFVLLLIVGSRRRAEDASVDRRRVEARAVTLAGIELLVFAGFWCLSGLALPYDATSPAAWLDHLRLVPAWSLCTLLACHAAAKVWAAGGLSRAVAIVAFAVVAASGARDAFLAVRGGNWREPGENLHRLAVVRGYAYPEYLAQLSHRLEGDVPTRARVMREFHDDDAVLLPAIAASLFDELHLSDAEAVERVREAFGAEWRTALLGLGRFLHTDWKYDVPGAFARLALLPADAREPLAEALGRAGLGPRLRPERIRDQLAIDVPDEYRAAWLRGTGHRIHQAFRFRPDAARAFLDACRPEQREDLERGWRAARQEDEWRR